jgi:hypothetical protein
MTDDSKLKMNDTWSENSTYSPKRRRIESGNAKSLPILLIILLILIFAGGIIYFFTPFRAPFDRDANIAPMSPFVKEKFCPQDAFLRPENFQANGLIIGKKCAKGNLEGRAVWILLN